LDEQKELIIFSIFQQHLNNIVPYSRPTTVNVELDYQPSHLSLAVIDNGQGFNARNKADGEDHIDAGIRNMRSRASLIGAAFQFTVLIGGGTRIFIDLPLE
jgi:signal transduction histidine kinase